MPLVEGESLRETNESRNGRCPSRRFTQILIEIAKRNWRMRTKQGVVHRDIKPENVMFFHGSAVVLDFGIGKALTAATPRRGGIGAGASRKRGMSLGTPTYISPEQAVGRP